MFEVTALVSKADGQHVSGAASYYVVKTVGGVYYVVYVDAAVDVVYRKSSDGITWSDATLIKTGNNSALSIWYDRWSNISAGLIHIVYNENGVDDILYRSIDTENSDTISTEKTVFASTGSVAIAGALSITRARGGNLICAYDINGGTTHNCSKSTTVGESASFADIASPTEGAVSDYMILLPGWAADNQDIMCIYWDASADEISRKNYDDSGDSWTTDAEASISTAMVEVTQGTYPHFAATVDITNSQNLLVAWNGVDTVSADLLGWKVTDAAITAFAVAGGAVVANGADDQGLCAIGIDTTTQDWYVFYGGASDGSNTWSTLMRFYYKVSTDDGATWGAETGLTPASSLHSVLGLWCTPRFDTSGMALWCQASQVALFAVANTPATGGDPIARPGLHSIESGISA